MSQEKKERDSERKRGKVAELKGKVNSKMIRANPASQ